VGRQILVGGAEQSEQEGRPRRRTTTSAKRAREAGYQRGEGAQHHRAQPIQRRSTRLPHREGVSGDRAAFPEGLRLWVLQRLRKAAEKWSEDKRR
jgi:hypothetical protein